MHYFKSIPAHTLWGLKSQERSNLVTRNCEVENASTRGWNRNRRNWHLLEASAHKYFARFFKYVIRGEYLNYTYFQILDALPLLSKPRPFFEHQMPPHLPIQNVAPGFLTRSLVSVISHIDHSSRFLITVSLKISNHCVSSQPTTKNPLLKTQATSNLYSFRTCNSSSLCSQIPKSFTSL